MANDGLVFYDNGSGVLFIGKDDEGRVREVQLAGANGGSLKLFSDGGFEILGQESSTLADNITSKASHGLKIYSKGDLNIATDGKLTISASQIIFDNKSATDDFVLKNENGGIRIESPNGNVGIKGNNVVVSASRNAIIKSKGNVHVVADGGQIFIVEPKSKLIPSSVLDIVNTVLTSLEGWV